MNALQSYQFQSNQLRIEVDEHGNPWFCAKDACEILGYANHSKAIKDHCKPDGVTNRYPITDALGRIQYPSFINEGNLYRLIIKSNKPEAEPFEAWVCDEILPAIRKTGGYGSALGKTIPAADYLALTYQVDELFSEMVALKDELLGLYRDRMPVREVAINKVPVEVVVLMEQYGVPREEIARVSGRTRNCIRQHVFNAKKPGGAQ